MAKIRDRVIMDLGKILLDAGCNPARVKRAIKRILSIKELAVVDREAKLPRILVDPALSRADNVRACKEAIRKDNWVREEK